MQNDTSDITRDRPTSSLTDEAAVRRQDLRDLDDAGLRELLRQLGQPAFRARQIEEWVWAKNASSFDEMTNLPKTLRAQLEERLYLDVPTEVVRQASADGSRKYLLRLADGVTVECVGMPSRDRLAVCASTQAGCGMGCAFCATGASGLTRSLSMAEIYEQVMHVRDDFGRRVTSVVLMGQGEPFANYDASVGALRKLNSPDGAGIGARHLTVSTCGIIPMIMRFANEPEQFSLAVSLHSAVQRTRDALMPGVKKFSLIHLYDAMGDYVDKTGRRPTYEYALIKGVNDTDDELGALCDFCRDNLAHVNLIKLNDVKGSRFQPSSDARAQEFVRRLSSVGVVATVRNSRGADIDAACGQLRQNVGRRSIR
ncbi:23S rRNA (adenine(2503)-C(2))-methyltransferase RlmN [Olsenella massiliensis]|uniref:23S rRNA (adenine(2503)-C(2))-methyltransferase RlmN n=1 Tax=Olsenella massiliensis TaxID=1622075 RepID=UPI0009EA58C0|nr:23S rRNA (adenine(2503)-C(2))-methyltransferase RlmN [Olsenella massiliensis]